MLLSFRTAHKMKFPADLVTFTEEILNETLFFVQFRDYAAAVFLHIKYSYNRQATIRITDIIPSAIKCVVFTASENVFGL